MTGPSPLVLEAKRLVAESLVRTKIDTTDDVLGLNAFFWDFRWKEGFTPEDLAGLWREFLRRKSPPGHLHSLYIHVPYCRKKCHFCYCATKVSTKAEVIDRYVPDLAAEIGFFAPLFSGRRIPLLQIGGGTPSVLSAAQLRELLARVRDSFELAPDGFFECELNPATTDEEKLAVLRSFGFSRVSFGVQSLSAEVLERENREYQTEEMTARAVSAARRLGFPVINVDLVLGLSGEPAESFVSGFEKLAALRPTTIVVAGLTLSDAYMKLRGLSREDNLAGYEKVLPKALEGMRAACRRHGYRGELGENQGIWTLEVEDAPQEPLSRIAKLSDANVSTLGLGHHARSSLFGAAVAERYPEAFAPGKPLYQVARLTPREEMMRFILRSLEERSSIGYAAFQARFGADLREAFPLQLKLLAALGKVKLETSGARFLPVRGPERMFYGAFFVAELISELPCAKGIISESFIRKLEKELGPVPFERLEAA